MEDRRKSPPETRASFQGPAASAFKYTVGNKSDDSGGTSHFRVKESNRESSAHKTKRGSKFSRAKGTLAEKKMRVEQLRRNRFT